MINRAIFVYLLDIFLPCFDGCIPSFVEIPDDGTNVHWLFHLVQVVGHVISVRVNWTLKINRDWKVVQALGDLQAALELDVRHPLIILTVPPVKPIEK